MTLEQLLVSNLCGSSIINDHMSEEDIAKLLKKQSDAIIKEFGWDKDEEVIPNVTKELVDAFVDSCGK
jgi:hypothetical protein